MERKLASIQRIKAITPIANADRIELAHVLGWQCVVKKDEFKVDELVIYFEIDSFLPIREEFEFLRSSSYKNSPGIGEGFRIKTHKMRGEISQGLICPLSILPEDGRNVVEGQDVTDILGVRKYELPPDTNMLGLTTGVRPWFIPKTSETRIQSEPSLLDEMKENLPCYVTTKMDGMSMSVYSFEHNIGVTSHTKEYADTPVSPLWECAHRQGIIDAIHNSTNPLSEHVCIQGEFCGPKIQSNHLNLQNTHFYAFTVIDLSVAGGRRLGLDEMTAYLNELSIDMVPIEEVYETLPFDTVEEILTRADGKYASGHAKEGIVIRPCTPVKSDTIQDWLSFKVLNNRYLLKEK